MPDARIFSNHLLIDAVAALFERDEDAYKPLRRALVRLVHCACNFMNSPVPER